MLEEAERGVNQENLGYPTSKDGPKWTCIPFSPLPKITKCGDVCSGQFVPLRHKPRDIDDDDGTSVLILPHLGVALLFCNAAHLMSF